MCILKKLSLCLVAVVLMYSCKRDDYTIGGSLHNPNVNMTTYEYLKSKPIFDTLVLLMDKAGVSSMLNDSITFFAPTDYDIQNYINMRNEEVREVDELLRYTVDTLIKYDLADFTDSIKMYMVPRRLYRDILTANGALYNTALGKQVKVSLETSDDYTDYVSTKPKYVYYTWIVNTLDDPNDTNVPDEEKDQKEVIQTSGIITTTGVIHVMNNNHVLFFRQ